MMRSRAPSRRRRARGGSRPSAGTRLQVRAALRPTRERAHVLRDVGAVDARAVVEMCRAPRWPKLPPSWRTVVETCGLGHVRGCSMRSVAVESGTNSAHRHAARELRGEYVVQPLRWFQRIMPASAITNTAPRSGRAAPAVRHTRRPAMNIVTAVIRLPGSTAMRSARRSSREVLRVHTGTGRSRRTGPAIAMPSTQRPPGCGDAARAGRTSVHRGELAPDEEHDRDGRRDAQPLDQLALEPVERWPRSTHVLERADADRSQQQPDVVHLHRAARARVRRVLRYRARAPPRAGPAAR